MPAPDFDQIAAAVLTTPGTSSLVARVAEQFRLVWNARGAADIATLEPSYVAAMPLRPSMETITRVLRSLDR